MTSQIQSVHLSTSLMGKSGLQARIGHLPFTRIAMMHKYFIHTTCLLFPFVSLIILLADNYGVFFRGFHTIGLSAATGFFFTWEKK